jgi:hypothetical protein
MIITYAIVIDKVVLISDLRLVVCESVNAKPYYINSVFLRVDNDKDENKHLRIIPSSSL